MGSPELKRDGIKEAKIWRHKGRQIWWKPVNISSCISRRCNTWTYWPSMLCITDSSKPGEELGIKEGASFGVPECSIDIII